MQKKIKINSRNQVLICLEEKNLDGLPSRPFTLLIVFFLVIQIIIQRFFLGLFFLGGLFRNSLSFMFHMECDIFTLGIFSACCGLFGRFFGFFLIQAAMAVPPIRSFLKILDMAVLLSNIQLFLF